jgi:NAD(P)-dependent dehydrogenase (short-subunit alcohol dehydrogenase family)
MGELDGRVAIITGAGRGLGREYATLFAREGAHVVVNDLGGGADGHGHSAGPAQRVVAEIEAAGGVAIANTDDISEWDGARRLIDTAVETYGDLHVLVNNAGILRDRGLVNMTADEWDSIMRVHLRGHFGTSHFAAVHWRARFKAGDHIDRSLINTSSPSGLLGNRGQANYGAAKAGIAAFTVISQIELSAYGVRCNAIAPAARTRLTTGEEEAAASNPLIDGVIDDGHPANVAAVVGYLATATCPLRGLVLLTRGRQVRAMQPWTPLEPIDNEGVWTFDDLRLRLDPLAELRFTTLDDVFPQESGRG